MKNTTFGLPVVIASMFLASSPVLAQSATAEGVVKKVDQSANKITIQHGPIKAFDMPDTMTMVYRVKDPVLLKDVKAGDKIKFDAEHASGGFTVTKMQKEK